MGPRSALSTRVLGLFLLGLASISSQSLYHLTLLLASLVLNAAFAFRRHFPSSQLTVDLCTVYVIAHLTLQFVAQVPFIRGYLTDTLSSILGIAKLYCPSKDEGLTCKEAFWSVYLGCFAEISLAVLLAWNRRASIIRVECNEEGYVRALRHFYLLTPVALISWALMFPSWLSFVWLLASWFIFSLIAERTHRISVAPFLISYASLLLLAQYVCSLFSFHGNVIEKIGLHSSRGSAAFYSLFWKWMLSMPFYIMRYLDGYPLHSSTEACVRRYTVRMFLLLIFINLRGMACNAGQRMDISRSGFSRFCVVAADPSYFIPHISAHEKAIIVVRRFESSLDATWRPSSPLSQALAAHYDTFLSLALCVFAALNISVIGLLLLLLSLLIFISTPKICRATCCAASVLLALLWLLSFLSSAMQLPVLVFPKDCQRTFIIDRNTTQWIGFWPVQTWPIIVLLFMISMRSTFSVDKTQWLCEITRIDAEKDITSLSKFLAKYWMHKFGVEASLIYGLILACSHEDIGGLLLLISILTLRALPRRRQALLWTAYSRLLLAFLVLQYVSALGTPHQFSKCFDQFWTDWPESIKRYFLLPSSVSSSPIIVADYILILLLLSDHPGGDNTPLLDPYQPIPSMYKDFISTKGNLVAYVHSVVFLYSHWITLVVVVVCCMEGGSVFAFAYLITVFVLLWKGTELYAAQPFDRFIASWNYLVYYNLAVLAIKAFYLNTMCAFGWAVPCWLERVLGVYCAQSSCLLRSGSSAIWFDVLCFAALIFQLRVFNSYYFQHVIVDYRADRILGSRGAELLLEVKEREGRKSERRLHCNVSWIEMVVAEEDREMPVSCGPAPRSHEEIKRSGYYHQTSERFFPKWLGSYDSETDREQRSAPALNGTSDVPITTSDESTMVEKTVEVLDSVRVTMMHLLQLVNNPEWLFRISKGHAYIAHVLENDKRRIKEILKERLLMSDSCEKLESLRGELALRDDFQSIASSETLWNEALEEWRSIHPAFNISHTVMAQSELVCFVLMVVVHLSKPSLLTLPFPLMVFAWGALCIPRPPRVFWILSAFYVQFIIIFRLLFQDGMVPGWSSHTNPDDGNPLCLARLLGMDRSTNGTFWDVALLSMVFLHRYKLLRLGMWSDWYHVREQPRTDPGTELGEQSEQPNENSSSERLLSCTRFVNALLAKKPPSSMDWYPWMVGCDALCLILISMFYSMIGQGGSGNVLLDVQASRLPRWFAYTLPLVFLIMIVDRWLYLSKRIVFRLAFYLALVFLLHTAIFFFVPSITGRPVTWNGAAIALYLIKCAYLLMSAWHIRNGYPSVVNQNILAKNYGLARLLILKIYLNIPFLFELRTAMDWTFTSTSLTMGDFIRLENYFNEVVQQNCWIQFDHWFDNYFATRKGRPTPTSGKFFKGVLSVIAIIIIILAPILLFAFLNSFGTRAPPERLRVTIGVEGYPALYEMEALYNEMPHISVSQMQNIWDTLSEKEDSDVRRSAFSFLGEYSNMDVFSIHLEWESFKVWTISPPAKHRLIKQLHTPKRMRLFFDIDLQREHGSSQRKHHYNMATTLSAVHAKSLVDLLEGGVEAINMTFPLPRFLLAPPLGDLGPANAINLALGTTESTTTWEYKQTYWNVRFHEPLIMFVDRVVPSWISTVIGSGGMMAMYVAVVLVVGRFMRAIVRTPLSNAMIENLPNADNLLRLFQDIYVVREKRHFYLESRLYGKLLFIVRSPDTVIRWSRYRVKVKED
ncbi:unnamed protein product [Toxocara canis]|uniref:Piezo_RRas_bdg domain-containing protein n=1 Tax=Toxocara canis TaxID=6265 RepID=A0A183UGL7_TOXCA|nr:unnamed protein product [Toxocara canis]